MTRAEQIEDGLLVDYTDISADLGYACGVAVAFPLEEALLATLPKLLETRPEAQEAGMGAAMMELLTAARTVLEETREGKDLVWRSGTHVAWEFKPSWKEDATLMVSIDLARDDHDEPCLTLDLRG